MILLVILLNIIGVPAIDGLARNSGGTPMRKRNLPQPFPRLFHCAQSAALRGVDHRMNK